MQSLLTDQEEQAVQDLMNRKTFKSLEAVDNYLIACHLNHLRRPMSLYRASAKPSLLATAGAKIKAARDEYVEPSLSHYSSLVERGSLN